MTQERTQAIPISQEDILNLLQTRGFESGFQSTPLRDFWGTLSSITGEMRSGQRGAFAVSLFNFNESDVEVLASTEPYTSPVAQIEIPVSKNAKSKMGYWGESVDVVINPGVDKTIPHDSPQVKKHGYLIGKRLHVALTPGHMIGFRDDTTGKWEDRPNDCWTLLEVQGGDTPVVVGPTTPTVSGVELALALLNGKTIQQWHQEVLSNQVVKNDTKLINQIISGEFIGGLEAAGKISKDDVGVYTVA